MTLKDKEIYIWEADDKDVEWDDDLGAKYSKEEGFLKSDVKEAVLEFQKELDYSKENCFLYTKESIINELERKFKELFGNFTNETKEDNK